MPTKYILDTCTVSHLLEGRESVIRRLNELPRSQTYITAITVAEAYFGIFSASKAKQEELEEMRIAVNSFPTLPITATVAMRHAQIKADSNSSGCKKDNDLWMVAFCEDEGATLITTDARLEHLQPFTGCLEIISI